jgi:hypothetical protein
MAPPAKGFPWSGVLIGCGVVLLIAIVGGIGTCYYVGHKSGELLTGAMDLVVTEYKKQLTPDHTQEQRERFETLAKAVFSDERNRLGMMKWAVDYNELTNQLTTISQDGAISVEESTEWCDQAYATLEKNGYWKGEEKKDENQND